MGLVSDLTQQIRDAGQIQAEREARRGQIIGGTLANIGQAIGSIPAQIQQRQAQAQHQQLVGLELQRAQTEAAQRQRGEADVAAIDTAMQSGGEDRKAIIKSLIDSGRGHLTPTLMKTWSDADKYSSEATKAKQESEERSNDYFAALASGVKALGATPEAFDIALKHAESKGYDTSEERALLQQSPEKLTGVLDALIARSPKYAPKEKPERAITTATLAADLSNPDPAVAARAQKALDALQAPAKAAAAASGANTAADNARADAGLAISRAHLALAQQRAKEESGAVPALTQEGIDAVALNFAKTGQLPPMGMGKTATELRTKIINRAAEMNPNLDLASNRAAFASNEGALKQLQKQRDAIGAFEQTAQKNIDVFLSTAGKVVDTGSPLANQAARYVTGKMLGSPDQAAYDAARQVAINEIAKITSNPNLSGTLSDTARKEVEAFNPSNATLKQSVAVMRLLKRDMQNRTDAMDAQIAAIKSRISGAKSAAPAGPQPGDLVVTFGPDGKPVVKKQGGD